MIHAKITHKKFGEGTITDLDQKHIKIIFKGQEKEKEFLYPEAFDNFLTLVNDEYQEKVDHDLQIVKKEKLEEREQICLERERLDEERRIQLKELRKRRMRAASRK